MDIHDTLKQTRARIPHIQVEPNPILTAYNSIEHGFDHGEFMSQRNSSFEWANVMMGRN